MVVVAQTRRWPLKLKVNNHGSTLDDESPISERARALSLDPLTDHVAERPLLPLTLVNRTAARDADATESAEIEFEHTPSDAEWEAIKAQMRYWQQLADQEPAR
ncbi:hypothetical protein MRX96_058660 [Rhipicephalus microplus]